MAVAVMVNIGIFSYIFCESKCSNSSRFPMYSIPLRITMCNINGIDMCGGKYLFMRSIEIEAVQWNGQNAGDIKNFLGIKGYYHILNDNSLIIPTLEGDMKAVVGDFIIKGVKGEFYPCKPDIFEMTYEKV